MKLNFNLTYFFIASAYNYILYVLHFVFISLLSTLVLNLFQSQLYCERQHEINCIFAFSKVSRDLVCI